MNEYSNNSITSSPKKKRKGNVKQVITSGVIKRPEPLIYRIFGGSVSETAQYVFWDVLIPSLKDTIIEMIQNGIEGLVRGDFSERSFRGHTKQHRGTSYVSYQNMYERPTRVVSPKGPNRFSDYIFVSRADANEVLSTMLEIIDTYDAVSVYEFFEAIGEPAEYTDNKYGWTNLARAKIQPVRNGYILNLPTPELID